MARPKTTHSNCRDCSAHLTSENQHDCDSRVNRGLCAACSNYRVRLRRKAVAARDPEGFRARYAAYQRKYRAARGDYPDKLRAAYEERLDHQRDEYKRDSDLRIRLASRVAGYHATVDVSDLDY